MTDRAGAGDAPGVRVIVGLAEGSDPATVATRLREAGARHVSAPLPSLPDVVVAEFPPDIEDPVARAQTVPGVRYAEPDVLRTID